jgi:histone demethylase JARID1
MVDREMGGRAYARSLGLGELLEEEDRPEDQYQCTICKMFCYLSQITCQCKTEVVCIDHAEFLCDHSVPQLIMRKRFSDADLLETLNKVSERASLPAVWRGKLNKLLMESARPQFRSLRALLAEGERINFFIPELAALRKCVIRGERVDGCRKHIPNSEAEPQTFSQVSWQAAGE